MKKNNNGFFLAETIIMIALVTTVIAFLYPNVSKLYENYNNRVNYYDQVQDIYVLRALEKYLYKEKFETIINFSNNLNVGEDMNEITDEVSKIGGLKELYITKYMNTPTSSNYEFNKYLKRLKKTTNSPSAYRLIGVFEGDSNLENDDRYASIKILGGHYE